MFGIGPVEMLTVGVIAILLFGNRLPQIARSLGQTITEFRRGVRELTEDTKATAKEIEQGLK